MEFLTGATNATKGLLTAGANLIVTGLDVFNIVDLTEEQTTWVYSAVNFFAILWMALTYKKSPKRIPDETG